MAKKQSKSKNVANERLTLEEKALKETQSMTKEEYENYLKEESKANDTKYSYTESQTASAIERSIGTVEHTLISDFLEKESDNLNFYYILVKGSWNRLNVETVNGHIPMYDDFKWYLIVKDNVCVMVCLGAEYDGSVRMPFIILSTNIKVTKSWLDNCYYELYKNVINYSTYQCKYLQVGLSEKGLLSKLEMITPDDDNYDNLIISKSNKKFVNNFIRSVSNGKQLRYLFNGDAGTGKTESMRYIINQLYGYATIIEPSNIDPDNFNEFMDTIQYFYNPILILDDVDLFLNDRENGGNSFLSNFLVHFDGIKKKKISILASTNDKTLVDKAAERPGRFNLTIDFNALEGEQIDQVIDNYFPEKWRFPKVYEYMKSKDEETNKSKYITGAFISNLVENLKEMEYDGKWDEESLIEFIDQNYKGFYRAIKSRDKTDNIKGFDD